MDSTQLKTLFDTKWGAFRKFIAANPLTGFWSGVIGGFILGGLLVWHG